MSENQVIGNKGEIPWHISEDFKRFKGLTTGHPIIMGRKTHESIGRILPSRTNIVITHDLKHRVKGAMVVHSVEEAIREAKQLDNKEIFVIGGAQIFNEVIDKADKLYLTIVKGNFPGDAFFPDYSRFKTEMYRRESSNEKYKYLFIDLVP